MLLQRFYSSPVDRAKSRASSRSRSKASSIFSGSTSASIAVAACILLAMKQLPLALVEWIVFAVSLVDGIFLAALTLVTGGYDSILYWLFPGADRPQRGERAARHLAADAQLHAERLLRAGRRHRL